MFRIKNVAVLGSGIMGSGIACHLANAGMDVLLLDLVTPGLEDSEIESKKARNKLVNESLAKTIKSKPAPLYRKSYSKRIRTGNFSDDFPKIKASDWIIEVVTERLEIKRSIFERVEKYRKPGSLVSTNTSGIQIHLLAKGRTEDFRKHFLGTHFFNPPRYLQLLEIIPSDDTLDEVVEFFMDFGRLVMGKTTVLCRDTPAFIGNRVGVFAMAKIFELTKELEITIQDADKLTGPALNRPKTGTFRLADLVGLDTAFHVIEGIRKNCPNDKSIQKLETQNFYQFLLDKGFLGNKSGQGFYKKINEKDEKGKSVILALNLKSLEYETQARSDLKSLSVSRQIENPVKRIPILFEFTDAGGELVRKSLAALFAYVSNRIPEICDNLYSIDDAIKAGFAWEYGPFETWDIIGIKAGIEAAESGSESVAKWVHDLVGHGFHSFYKLENGTKLYYDIQSGAYRPVPKQNEQINLANLREKETVFKNDEVILHDIDDSVLCLEFTSKINTIGEGVLNGINEAISIAENGDWKGLVIGNHAQHFTVGANLMMIAMMAYQQDFDSLSKAVQYFQNTIMRCRYSQIPVVAATQGYVFGGGCEMIMHCDSTQCAAESYIGLVEAGIGLIPGGGGTKEIALRTSDKFFEGDVQVPTLIEAFKTIALGKVSTSAHEAFDLGYLNSKDHISLNRSRNIWEAKERVLELATDYIQPSQRNDIRVLGRSGLAALYAASNEFKLGNFASEHDIKIANKVAWVLCGGDLTSPQDVSETYLLDLEREAFISLCGEPKTLERIQYMLENNRPLRN